MDIGNEFLQLVMKMQNGISLVLSATKISLILGLKPSLNKNPPKPKISVPVLDGPKSRLSPKPSAIWLRDEFATQRNKTFFFVAVIFQPL